MISLFDLDGTLIDNRRAVEEAYRAVGIIRPDKAWGRPVDRASCSGAQHIMKNRIYPDMLRMHAKEGPGLKWWMAVKDNKWVITGASQAGARSSMKFLGLDTALLLSHGLTIKQKCDLIKSMKEPVVYIDSDFDVADQIRKDTECSILVP